MGEQWAGCCQGGGQQVQYADGDGRGHTLLVKNGKLWHRDENGHLSEVGRLSFKRRASGAEIHEETLGKATLSKDQMRRITDLAERSSCILEEAPKTQEVVVPKPLEVPSKQPEALPPTAKAQAYEIGDWVKVWSVSRSRWIRAQVIDVQNEIVTVSYKSPDGPKEKQLPIGHQYLQMAMPNEQGPDASWLVMGKYTMFMGDEDIMGEGSSSICRRGIDNETGKSLAIKVYKATPDFVEQQGFFAEDMQEDWEAITMLKYKRQVQVLLDLLKPLEMPFDSGLWCDELEEVQVDTLFMQLVDFSRDADGNPAVDPDDGLLYVVTELAEYSLLDYLNDRRERGEQLSKENVCVLAHAIIRIVAGLHAKGYVHLDLKPENLMVFDGCLKLIDVDGCMKIDSEVSLLDPSLSCSPVYCSPEWAEFCLDEAEDPRTILRPHFDVWSVGVTICELVTLEPLLMKQYNDFLGDNQDVASLFMGWLSKQEEAPIPESMQEFDPGLCAFLRETLMVCDATCRHSLAQALSHQYFNSGEDDKKDKAETRSTGSDPLVFPKEAPRKLRRDRSHEELHKGVMRMLKPGGQLNVDDPLQWLVCKVWITSSGSLCYSNVEDDEPRILVEGKSFRVAHLTMLDVGELVFQLEVGQVSAIFASENQADHNAFVTAFSEVKNGAGKSLNFGQHMANLRAAKNQRLVAETEMHSPVFKRKVWKLRADGDRMSHEDWFEFDMWLAKDGSFCYWSNKEEKELIQYTANAVANAMLKKITNEKSAKPWSFQVQIPGRHGVGFEPGEYAAETSSERDLWMQEFRRRQKEMGKMKPSKEVCAEIDIKRLGMEFESTPPEPAVVKIIKPGLWAQTVGIQPGDEIVQLNQICVCDLTFNEFMLELQKRPIKMGIAVPKLQDRAMDSDGEPGMQRFKSYRAIKRPKSVKQGKAKEPKSVAALTPDMPQAKDARRAGASPSSQGSNASSARRQQGRGKKGRSAPVVSQQQSETSRQQSTASQQQSAGSKAKGPMPAG
mmetsp:Transcript_5428/g.13455  ORF Transcript_5428/g.13455 Transcript_5428/m.13455 type:complete len:1010 (+) Transcript_5428:125-3154(+)